MSQDAQSSTRSDPVGRVLTRVTRLFVIVGGISLTAAGFLTVASVMGRYLINAPIPGDFELVETACALAVFSFLPYCQLQKGNVLVDFFTYKLSARSRGLLDSLSALIYTVIAVLLTWRLWVGGLDLLRTNEQTIVLQIPRAYNFIFIMPCMALLVVVSAYTIWDHLKSAEDEPPPPGHPSPET
jgi:TRAP-type C4-dicarboxylate transport system permease small subunit